LFGLESEGRFEFLPMIFCPFDDVTHIDLSCGQSDEDESEQTGEGMGDALFGAGSGDGVDRSGECGKGRSGHRKPPWLVGIE
jgi:hypothetical protein